MAHKHGGFTSRTKARKRATDVLFEADQRARGASPAAILQLLEERKVLTAAQTPLPDYSATLVEGVAKSLPRIDGLLRAHTKNREFTRLPAVDLAVMRVAVWEMLENSAEVPRITAIDEAVAIVKHISTAESPSYVNAVLDAVRKDIEESASDSTISEIEINCIEKAQVVASENEKNSANETAESGAGQVSEAEIEDASLADIDENLLDDLLNEY